MNHLLAKTKGKKGDFLTVLSGKTFFSTPKDLGNVKPYSPTYKLEEEEWYAIEKFSEQEFCIDFLKKKFIAVEYMQIEPKKYNDIQYLCAVQDSKYFFQKITAGQLVKKKFISLSADITFIENEPIIVITNYSDAIYDNQDDILYFKNLSTVQSIFQGIEELFREATQKETEEFLENDFMKLGDGYNADAVKKANRKRITLALKALNSYNKKEKKEMITYIQEYCKKIVFKNNAFEIKTEEDLKEIIYGIEQRYYTTRFGLHKRIVNSYEDIKP
jgi:hypothetical protein